MRFFTDAVIWGSLLWLFGYVLGFVFFVFVPLDLIGWFIMPFGIAAALWILLTKVHGGSLWYYGMIALVWTLLAVVLDYFLLVQLLNPPDGYYKPAVYIYYALTFSLPLVVGRWFRPSR